MVLSFPLTPRSLVTGLTQAECAVVKGLLLGRSNAEIAASRAVAPSTVKNQVAAIFQKLGVHSRLELAIALGCSLAAPNAEACADGSTL